MGKQLLEIVKQQSWSRRQHGQWCIGAHRAKCFEPGFGHGRDDHFHVFVRVAKHLLATQHAFVAVHHVFAIGQVGQRHHAFGQPLGIRVGGSERCFEFFVVDDATAGSVDQQHAAWLQAAFAHHALGRHIHHTHFAGHDYQIVIGYPIAARAQTVAVKHRTNHGAIAKRHAGWAIPWLDQRRVIAIKRAFVVAHRGVVFPRLGDHHHHGVWQRAPREVQQFEHFIKTHRVATTRRANGERAFKPGNQRCFKQRFARAHPVAVALHGVDFAVVGDVAIRVRQRPRRKRVGAKAAVHQHHGRFHIGV